MSRALAMLLALIGLSACSGHSVTSAESWWHQRIGGRIAEQRPPPPGAKDPYPNLSTVPPKPAPTDTATWNRMTAGLINDRIQADEAAALAPIPPPVSGTPVSPSLDPTRKPAAGLAPLPGAPVSPPLDTGQKPAAEPGASASLAAPASPPPAKSTPGKSTPASALPTAPPGPPAAISVTQEAARVANGPLPALPTSEPARPGIAPPPPPPAVPITTAPPIAPAPAPGGLDVDFSRQSAALTDAALEDVKTLAAERGDRGIAVTGYGDASASDALGQAEALDLGLRRAQALATALVARGVPYAALRIGAESAGRGASLLLLQ